MPFDEAAGFLITYGTAYYALVDRAALRAGETVLVLGASGGLGLAALELAKALGAHVVAAVSSEEKAAFARSRGADATLVYPSGPFDTAEAVKALAGLFKSACGAQGADVIVDPVGGAYCEAALRAIAWEGRHLVIGFPAGIPKLPLNLVLLKSCQVVGVFWGAFEARDPAALARHVSALFALYEKGAIKPAISRRFSLENAAEAIAALANRDALGKLIVLIN
jgi:NADPH2:quinone reductase